MLIETVPAGDSPEELIAGGDAVGREESPAGSQVGSLETFQGACAVWGCCAGGRARSGVKMRPLLTDLQRPA